MMHRRAAAVLAAVCCLFALAACSAGDAVPARGSRPTRTATTADITDCTTVASRENGQTTASPTAGTQTDAALTEMTARSSGAQQTATAATRTAAVSTSVSAAVSVTTAAASTVTTTTTAATTAATTTASASWSPLNHAVMKACWLSQYDLVGVMRVSSGGKYAQRPREDFTARVRVMLQNLRDMGFNTVIVQVRPFGDSFYPSDYYPWSDYVTGTMGKTPDYDPFAVIVEEAHLRGLSVHAWINPIRGMKEALIAGVPARYKLRQWYDDPAARGDKILAVGGLWYLNPAHADVRALIAAGAAEVVRKYHVDGVHMDEIGRAHV